MKTSLFSRTDVLVGLAAISIGAIGFVIYWQYTPEVDSQPSSAPVYSIDMTSGQAIPLTTKVKNPAGISYLADSDTFLISTDDRVVAEVSSDFKTVLSSMTVDANPLKIGDTEGVVYLGNGEAAAIGETGAVVMLKRDKGNWIEVDRFPISTFKKGTQLGSAAFDPQSRTLYSAQKKNGKVLYKINLDSRESEAIPMQLDIKLHEKSGRSWNEFYVAGLQFHEGKLYGVSESFSSILTITTSGLVENITGVSNINESSGITVREGVFTLLGDAENYLPVPPIYIIDEGGI